MRLASERILLLIGVGLTHQFQGEKKEFATLMSLSKKTLDALAAPVPAEEIQTIPNSKIRYTSDKFVMDRLDSVVGSDGWEDHYSEVVFPRPVEIKNRDGKVLKTVVGSVICDLTITDSEGSATHGSTAPMENDIGMYGTPDTNGQATALKRAAMKFGVAKELWKRGESAQGSSTSSQASSSSKSSGSSKPSSSTASSGGATASESQVNWLCEAFGLEADRKVVAKLTKGTYDKNTKRSDGEFQGILDYLKAARKDDDDFEDNAHEHFVAGLRKVAPRLLSEVKSDEPEYDDYDPEEE